MANQFEEAMLRARLLVANYPQKREKISRKLAKDFGWLPFGYDGPEYWDEDHFNKILKEKAIKKNIEQELKEIRQKNNERRRGYKKLIKKHKLGPKELKLINIINTLAIWTDERKRLDYELNYYYAGILMEIGKRFSIPYENLKSLFFEELKKIKTNREEILDLSEKRIRTDILAEFRKGQYVFLSNKKKKSILDELKKQSQSSVIQGLVACRGEKTVYTGKIKVLISAKEGFKIKKGDFLVTAMTTPDFVLSMKIAAGFITDEGGVTCHAAIVAREMNKPCIIGTRNATKVLKDGDEIEMDMATGVIKKLN